LGRQYLFPSLVDLEIGAVEPGIVSLYGTLPAEWGQATTFQQLELLILSNCNITGIRATCYSHLPNKSFAQTMPAI